MFRFAAGATMMACVAAASLAAQGGPYERQKIDTAAAGRGRALYAQHCINCHGSAAKGSDRGPDLIRSTVVLRDRLGSGIGPAIRPSAAHQAALTQAQVLDLSHFLHERIEAVATNRTPRGPMNILTGDPEAGRRYFTGAGGCSACHSPTGDLAAVATRNANPVNLQQRFLFPTLRRGQVQVDVMLTSTGRRVTGTLVRADDFSVSLRNASGDYQSFSRGPDVTVTIQDPLAAHYALLDRYTDDDSTTSPRICRC
jgi:mono/diheme cytochrome c family protein